jgi:hypothetical protein
MMFSAKMLVVIVVLILLKEIHGRTPPGSVSTFVVETSSPSLLPPPPPPPDPLNDQNQIEEISKLAPQWLINTATICVAVFALVSACLALTKLTMEVIEKFKKPTPAANPIYYRLNVMADDSNASGAETQAKDPASGDETQAKDPASDDEIKAERDPAHVNVVKPAARFRSLFPFPRRKTT